MLGWRAANGIGVRILLRAVSYTGNHHHLGVSVYGFKGTTYMIVHVAWQDILHGIRTAKQWTHWVGSLSSWREGVLPLYRKVS